MGLKIKKTFTVINLIVFLFGVYSSQAKPEKEVLAPPISTPQMIVGAKWSFSVEQKNDKEATLILKAAITKTYHIYSQFKVNEDQIPLPTEFRFKPSDKYELIGKAEEIGVVEEFDPANEAKLRLLFNEGIFKQKIKIKSTSKFKIEGQLTYMACDDKQCLPPEDIDFSFDINKDSKTGSIVPAVSETTHVAVVTPSVDTTKLPADTSNNPVNESAVASSDPNYLEPGCGNWASGEFADNSLWGIFIAGFIGGLLALLTPCVFPMIPMTVSFFTKRSGTRKKGVTNAIIYALSIIVLYVSLGFLVTITLGSDALNDLSTNGFFNISFFIIFIIFAISFFGAFEIVLPSWLVNKADAQSDKGGLIGIFFMAFTLSLVSFSCTGPIIGTLLVEAAHGRSYLGPVTGMTGFALALALPFALFAAFPGWLNSLPKSGGWLNSVKVCLGFIELALAFKFLSNVDLAYHWNIITREVFISVWVIIFGMMGFYLLGKLKFAHDSEVMHISVSRLVFAILTLTFTVYMIPGIWGAPLKLLSGILPPEYYKEWRDKNATDCPHNLSCFHDYDEGMAYAKAQGKPVFIDFTGYNCANCRKMEQDVWVDPAVMKHLSDDYVLISLYVDDKEELPAAQQYVSKFSGQTIKTKGKKWGDMEASRFGKQAQPLYAVIDHHERLLSNSWVGYKNDSRLYTQFLREGLCRFKERK